LSYFNVLYLIRVTLRRLAQLSNTH